jgi:hypothetical protein
MVNLFGALLALHQQPTKHRQYHCQQDIGAIVFLFICRSHHQLLQAKLLGGIAHSYF